ncbi:response regulator [Chryseobacterium sp. MEBOG07]|uniref:response regulator n=1 Tax=Chryseobacterium sp. MEBOG07 TaxID=2879939 RepID=UPI001F43FE03|nr:response regulator transcription factor [Chryseobacterium sp. MEBOG07]UKB78304.1 response regulator transcription factor [Chryseobacterium sp. MEBOG07]
MKNKSVKIAIVDDHPIVIHGLVNILTQNNNFDIVVTFTEGKKIIEYIKSHHLDVILLDINLPDGNGAEICKEIKKKNPDIVVILISNRAERTIILQSLQNGANGYLLKNSSIEELNQSINDALNGKIVFNDEIIQIISKPSLLKLHQDPKLTFRETEILQLIAKGKTGPEVAEILSLSILTVATHRKNILQKFNANSTLEVINLAKEYGIL